MAVEQGALVDVFMAESTMRIWEREHLVKTVANVRKDIDGELRSFPGCLPVDDRAGG